MIFGELALDQAQGAILAHSQRLPGRMIRKGTTLDADSIATLRQAGQTSVIAARLEAGDVGEDECARRLAAPLVAPGLTASRAATGRVNLLADQPGLLRVDAASVARLNRVDEALTLATLPDWAVVAARDLVATIKVIPFAVAGAVLAAAERAAHAATPALALHPFRARRVGLVLTELPGLKDSVLAGTIAATEARLARLTGTLLPPLRCAHAQDAIAAALRVLLDQGADLLLVAGASAVVDRRDVGPSGIVAAGGAITHFGMPVDPGNLICLGAIGAVPALVLPGCARSPKANGIDWVLARLFAGLAVTGSDIMGLGVGGLLKETEARPLPRVRATAAEPATEAPAHPARTPPAAIVLAAGQSSRMAPHNKLLLADAAGRAMVARVVDNVLSSGARPVLVVVGHQEEAVRAALAGRPVRFIEARDHAQGLSASLKAGIAAVPPDCPGAIVCLGDMPLVTGRMIDRVLAAFDPDEGRAIVLPTCRGKPGNPILWDRGFFPEILDLSGDAGARSLLQRHVEMVAEVELGEDAVLRDFDTVDAVMTLPERMRPRAWDAQSDAGAAAPAGPSSA